MMPMSFKNLACGGEEKDRIEIMSQRARHLSLYLRVCINALSDIHDQIRLPRRLPNS